MPIRIFRTSTPGAVPTSLVAGQLAINDADGKIFYLNSGGTIVSIDLLRKATQAEVDAGTSEDVAVTPKTLASWSGRWEPFLVKNGAPVAADIPAGTSRVIKNTATGQFSLFVNDGGTIIDLINKGQF